jgi:hypothetical protein
MITLDELRQLTDDQLIEKLAVDVMGWQNVWCMKCHNTGMHLGKYRMPCRDCASWRGLGLTLPPRPWNPLTDWNHWREVELKLMEDETLWHDFLKALSAITGDITHHIGVYMEADLPTRVSALISAHQELYGK